MLAPIAFLLVALMVAVSADGPRPRADFILVQRAEVTTLDPVRMSWIHDFRTGRALYEGLATLDPDTNVARPGVAERWETSADGRHWTFHLRPNARWSNGDAVTSADFIAAYRRALLPETAADYSGFLFHLRGAEEFLAWRSTQLAEYAKRPASERNDAAAERLWNEAVRHFDETVGVRATAPNTLEFDLKHPVAYFLDLVAFPALAPVHRPGIEDASHLDPSSGRLIQRQEWTKPGRLVSNGPYRLVEWRYKRDMRLERNDYYWNAAAVRSRTVEIRIIEDANTTVLAAEAGSVDWVTDTMVDYRAEMLAERRRYDERHAGELAKAGPTTIDATLGALDPPRAGERRDIHAMRAFGTDFYSFNCRPTLPNGKANPFADPRVRRAFALAVDRQALVDRVTRLGEEPSNVLVPRDTIRGYASPKGLPFDVARAKRELAEAGWADRNGDGLIENERGERFPTVDILYSLGSPRFRDLTFALREMWRGSLGVDVQPRGKEVRDFREDLKQGDFMVARGGWYGDYGDPTTFLSISRSDDGNNDRRYDSPRFDGLLDAAESELDPAKRLAILADAERLLVEEDLPILPLYGSVLIYMYDPATVRGLTHHPRLEQRIDRLERVGGAAATAASVGGSSR